MKKLIALLLAVAMIAAVTVGCANTAQQPTEEPTTEAPTTEEPTTEEPTTEEPTTEAPVDDTTEAPVAGTSELENVINEILKIQLVEFMGGMIPVDLTDTSEDGLWNIKYFTGLDSAEKISEAVVYEPMMGSMAFSMVLVKLNDAADAESVAQQMKNGIDTRKWICVEANDLKVCGFGDTVMLIMVDSSMGLFAQDFVDAFQTVSGGTLDFVLE